MNKTYLRPVVSVHSLAFSSSLLSASGPHSSSADASGQKEELIFDISEAEEAGKGFRANAKPFQDEFTAE
ncbi:hypothetical protein HMPREF2983_01450 [Prevotella sp. HMSC077E09]|uniref:hypothetical protein n=1 Tax=Prevotella sp. HMSC077E09 TaxID=1739487 RepID=UPI0008A2BF6F|nr:MULTISPECIES: hypothetical protein [unclassified Prevotella]OFO71889.1 hypothetical protein HMPREF3018_12035 [Prevotella sp. HMSC077E08]OFP52869.1 hypothetical protein HMPREF2983_01450 [Prevotella sp. HMSC077E09]